MSMNTRSELEEERRLFYVAITRAVEHAVVTYTQNRYRWGKLIDVEPSRFIEEMDSKYLEFDIPKDDYIFKPLLNKSIFDDTPSSNSYQYKEKPKPKTIPTKVNTSPSQNQLGKLRKLNIVESSASATPTTELLNLTEGMMVEHGRFGKGKVMQIEGKANDKKATIEFRGIGLKNLLLRFAKLKILNQ